MVLVGLALGFALTPSAARADIVFSFGNHPAPGQENVQFPTTNVPGNTVVGATNQTNTPVNFTSPQTIVAPSGGQARVEATSGDLNNITIALDPGETFSHLIFNAFNGTGNANVSVVDNSGSQTVLLFFALGNGENFMTVDAINGQQIRSVQIATAGGFADLRQVRIGFAAAAVPEPMSMGLLAAGGLPLLGFLRRRRQRAEDEPAA
jgi:hypothetical protein